MWPICRNVTIKYNLNIHFDQWKHGGVVVYLQSSLWWDWLRTSSAAWSSWICLFSQRRAWACLHPLFREEINEGRCLHYEFTNKYFQKDWPIHGTSILWNLEGSFITNVLLCAQIAWTNWLCSRLSRWISFMSRCRRLTFYIYI